MEYDYYTGIWRKGWERNRKKKEMRFGFLPSEIRNPLASASEGRILMVRLGYEKGQKDRTADHDQRIVSSFCSGAEAEWI
jgi:hypothetical protein